MEHVSEREKTLEHEVVFLRQELNLLKAAKAVLLERIENVKYELNEKLEDELDHFKNEAETLRAALTARLENVQDGDVFLIPDQEVANAMNKPLLMEFSRRFNCVFITSSGFAQIQKLTDEQLEKLNLKKIASGDRSTASHKLEMLLVSVKTVRESIPWTEDELGMIMGIQNLLHQSITAFQEFEVLVNKRGKTV